MRQSLRGARAQKLHSYVMCTQIFYNIQWYIRMPTINYELIMHKFLCNTLRLCNMRRCTDLIALRFIMLFVVQTISTHKQREHTLIVTQLGMCSSSTHVNTNTIRHAPQISTEYTNVCTAKYQSNAIRYTLQISIKYHTIHLARHVVQIHIVNQNILIYTLCTATLHLVPFNFPFSGHVRTVHN